jgi:hypothetical protein
LRGTVVEPTKQTPQMGQMMPARIVLVHNDLQHVEPTLAADDGVRADDVLEPLIIIAWTGFALTSFAHGLAIGLLLSAALWALINLGIWFIV